MKTIRYETDALGKIGVPSAAYFGSFTARSIQNYPISKRINHPQLIRSIVIIKKAAALVNHSLGLLKLPLAKAIIQTCDELLNGKFSEEFKVDIYQAGAGTSLHMNINEVIANRSNEILGAPLGSYRFIHPNDDVNMSQSTNDVIPCAIRLSTLMELDDLLKTLKKLSKEVQNKSKEFGFYVKAGRTHLQDALPITFKLELESYSLSLKKDSQQIRNVRSKLNRIGIGGTAVGNGANSHPKFHLMMIKELRRLTGYPLTPSGNLAEPMQNTSDFLNVSASLRTLAQTLIRIGNDLRLLSSGPNAGISELTLPEVQPGSSIMPGKVNPSIIEMLSMVCFQVIGYDLAILFASHAGQLELNVFTPLIAHNLHEQIDLLNNSVGIFCDRCVCGIRINPTMVKFWLERSSGWAALLNPLIGYKKTAQLVNESQKKGVSLAELVASYGILTDKQIKKILSGMRGVKIN